MSLLKDILTLAAALLPPLLLDRDKAREETIARIRRAQDRLLDKRCKLENELNRLNSPE